ELRGPRRRDPQAEQETRQGAAERRRGQCGQVGVRGVQPDARAGILGGAQQHPGLVAHAQTGGVDVVEQPALAAWHLEPHDRALAERLAGVQGEGRRAQAQRVLEQLRLLGGDRFRHTSIASCGTGRVDETPLRMATAFAAPGDTGEVTETPSPPRRRLSISVRTRIVAALTVAAALGLAAVGFSVYLVERHRILDGIDERLMANLESARFLTA